MCISDTVGYFGSNIIVSSHRTVHTIDFLQVTTDELKTFEIDFSFRIDRTGLFSDFFDIS
jgi:hypothetical protein